jgi:hypothetical protein
MKYAKLWVLLVALIVGAGVAIYLGTRAKSETKTVTGCLQKREAKGSKKENGYLQVTKLTMVSTSCQ